MSLEINHKEADPNLAAEIERLLAELAAWRKTFPMHEYSRALDCILSVEPFRDAPPPPQG